MLSRLKLIYYKFLSANSVAKKEGVVFGKNCQFGSKNFGSEPYLIEVGDNFKTSSGVSYITHDGSVHVLRNKYKELEKIDLFGKITIGNNVFIGLNCIILPGTVIEDNVIVGAGSVVRGHLKTNSIYAGVPVKFILKVDDYYEKHMKNFIFSKHLSPKDKHDYIIERLF